MSSLKPGKNNMIKVDKIVCVSYYFAINEFRLFSYIISLFTLRINIIMTLVDFDY